jgi:hypothetical protein
MEFGMASAMSCYRRNQCRTKRIGPEHIKALKMPEACLYGILKIFATVISELISINSTSHLKNSRLRSRTRQKPTQKRSIRAVCEHFKEDFNAVIEC